MTKTEQRPTYRVTWRMVQVQGHPRHSITNPNRTLYEGDIVADWAADSELARLQELGCIERAS